MPAKSSNRVLRVHKGVAYIEVGTPRYPGVIAWVDISDLPLVIDGCGRWFAAALKKNPTTLYVARNRGRGRPFQLLHRVILGLVKRSEQGDHRNGNGLDNRRLNIRPATNGQNSWNRGRRRNGTSRFKGVSWDAARKKWTASIKNLGKKLGREALGRFDREEDAARAYDLVAKERYGEFAFQNFKEVK